MTNTAVHLHKAVNDTHTLRGLSVSVGTVHQCVGHFAPAPYVIIGGRLWTESLACLERKMV